MSTTLPVACFAQPLTDELLARYQQLIDAVPDEYEEAREAMQVCLNACLAWWEIPESSRTDGRTLTVKHRGEVRTVRVTPLEATQVKLLWDAVPWVRECDAMKPLFDALQKEANDRNTAKLQNWVDAIRASLLRKYLKSGELQLVNSPVYASLRHLVDSLRKHLPTSPAVLTGVLSSVVPDMTPEDFDGLSDKLNQVTAALTAVVNDEVEGGIPRPQLEPTELRNAAHHLLWHALELARDREPLTKDKL